MDAERQRIINDAARILGRINQLFADTAYWNGLHPEEAPINPDLDGQLSHWKRGLELTLQHEAALGNFPSVDSPVDEHF